MYFLFRSLPKPHSHSHSHHHHRSHRRTFVDSTIKHVRDRGLDHAVEREKNLKPIHDIKNMIKSEPSKSLPISIITQHRDSLNIPFRPIELIRKYPSIFQEFLPGGPGTGIDPHIKLTPDVLNLDAKENLVFQTVSYKQNVAVRLLKLLMLSRINKIPLRVLEILKWDLGLPNDYVKSVVPEFPDYFRVIGGGLDSVLELVCWSDEMAVSVLEKKVKKAEMGNENGMPIAFPMQFSRGFEIDKKLKKWMDDWQKLPYLSPYENLVHLSPSSDESDKWAVGVLHELLHLFVGKKADRENVYCLGEYMGIRSRFKRALLHHPEIFYLSSKLGTYTVVLREGYKRGLLIESNPLIIRNKYVHLMHMMKEDKKPVSVLDGSTQQQKGKTNDDDGEDDDNAEEDDASDDYEEEEEEEEEEEDESHRDARENFSVNRGIRNRKTNLDVKGGSRNTERERSGGKHFSKGKDKGPSRERTEMHGGRNSHWSSQENGPLKGLRTEKHDGHKGHESYQESGRPKFRRTEMHGGHNGRGSSHESSPPKGRRTEMHGGHNGRGSSPERSRSPRSRGRSLPDKRRTST